jgi:hypothetical protein
MILSTITETGNIHFILTQSIYSATEAASKTEIHAIITTVKTVNSPGFNTNQLNT